MGLVVAAMTPEAWDTLQVALIFAYLAVMAWMVRR